MPTRRELFLQNALARTIILLGQCAQHFHRPTFSQQTSLLLEIESFFSEMKSSVAEELSAEARAEEELAISARRAEVFGVQYSWGKTRGDRLISPAEPMGTGASSSPSPGGTNSTDPDESDNLLLSPSQSFSMRLKFALIKSGKIGDTSYD